MTTTGTCLFLAQHLAGLSGWERLALSRISDEPDWYSLPFSTKRYGLRTLHIHPESFDPPPSIHPFVRSFIHSSPFPFSFPIVFPFKPPPITYLILSPSDDPFRPHQIIRHCVCPHSVLSSIQQKPLPHDNANTYRTFLTYYACTDPRTQRRKTFTTQVLRIMQAAFSSHGGEGCICDFGVSSYSR